MYATIDEYADCGGRIISQKCFWGYFLLTSMDFVISYESCQLKTEFTRFGFASTNKTRSKVTSAIDWSAVKDSSAGKPATNQTPGLLCPAFFPEERPWRLLMIGESLFWFVRNFAQLANHKNTIILMVPTETGNNANAKFWRDKQRVLWYFWHWLINVFLKSSVETRDGSQYDC